MANTLNALTELLKIMLVVWGSVVALWIPAIFVALYIYPNIFG